MEQLSLKNLNATQVATLKALASLDSTTYHTASIVLRQRAGQSEPGEFGSSSGSIARTLRTLQEKGFVKSILNGRVNYWTATCEAIRLCREASTC